MFTGIIEEVGVVQAASDGDLTIAAKKVLWGTNLGDSICRQRRRPHGETLR